MYTNIDEMMREVRLWSNEVESCLEANMYDDALHACMKLRHVMGELTSKIYDLVEENSED